MREASGKFSSLRESSYRVLVLVVVISCHLGLLMLVLRPARFHRETTRVAREDAPALKLRFFQPAQPSSPTPALPAHRPVTPGAYSHATLPGLSKPAAVQQVAPPPYAAPSTSTPYPNASEAGSVSDGGFQERLRHAQHSNAVHGVPGSATPYAPGIHLIDQMNQGIGAVMRTAQRAFGIKNSHCIDVDVWRQLTPQELSARHVSPGDVDKVDKKYNCNRPPGLHF